MEKNIIIKKLKRQIQSIWLLQFKDSNDIKFKDWARTTRLYIVNLSLDKKDEYIRKEYLTMFDDCVNKMPHYDDILSLWKENEIREKIEDAKKDIQNLLRSIIEILEINNESEWWKVRNKNQTKINIDNTQFNIQKINIKQIIKNTKSMIEKENKTKEEQEKAKKKLKEIEKELEKKSWWKNREKVKGILKRLADFWKETFIAILPAILKHYWIQD